ncbi:MAG: hypothetical protein WD314_02285 [Trueperaceae bacterium]
MAVLIQDLNLIVRVSTLARKYRGGVMQFQRDWLDDGFCCDGLLARVGSPARSDIDVLIDRLREEGFVMADEFGFRDMAIVDERRGMPDGCLWLCTGRRPDGMSFAYQRGSDPDALIAIPHGWSVASWRAQEQMQATGDPRAQLLFIRSDGECDVYLNRRTGQEVRVVRSGKLAGPRLVN